MRKENWIGNGLRIIVLREEKIAKNLNISLDGIVFVGDSDNDIEVFEMTKHGITINSFCKKLKEVAWEDIESLLEIRHIL